MRACVSLLLGLTLALAVSVTAFAHIGEMQFIPQVPNPGAMTIDGNDDDWGWMDQAYAWTSDKMVKGGSEPDFTREDFDVVYYMGWSAPPDRDFGAFYMFARTTDDVLDINEGNPDWWWADDAFNLAFDPDHSGGNIFGTEIEHTQNGHRYQVRIASSSAGQENYEYGRTGLYFGPSIYLGLPELRWGNEAPYCDFASTLLPAGSEHGATDVTYTYEIKMNLWDFYGLSRDESTPHVFAADQVIHMQCLFGDSDIVDVRNEGGQESTLTLGPPVATHINADEHYDHYLVAAEGVRSTPYSTRRRNPPW